MWNPWHRYYWDRLCYWLRSYEVERNVFLFTLIVLAAIVLLAFTRCS
jgi:hypothetical protein